jgi:peptidoglycan/xylan/chitin deacetylase (PgdA/CDA1 family)
MRTGAIAAGVVVVALAGSLGIIYAQKDGMPLQRLAKAGPEATGMAADDNALPKASHEAQVSPAQTAPTVVAQAGGPGVMAAPLKVAAQPSPAQPGMAQPSAAQASPPPPSQPQLTPADVMKGPPCNNPDALGVSRVVEIDTTGGPGFGSGHFHQYDFLRPGEVVLTFDDGPWLINTETVLKALADQCVRATFFAIGKHATYYPEILRQVYKAGHTVGSHTWSHQDLSKKTPEEGKQEIEMGVSAVKMALGRPIAPFFRFPALRHPPEMVAYLGERGVGIFSMDTDSLDFKIRKPERIIRNIMASLKKHGKGIILMHDFQRGTSHAVPELLAELKAGGYKIVHMVPRGRLDSLAQYDDMVNQATTKTGQLQTGTGRPTSSVVRTIGQQ